MADIEVKTCWFCGEDITDNHYKLVPIDGKEFFIHDGCNIEYEKNKQIAKVIKSELNPSGILNFLAWANLLICIVGAIIIWATIGTTQTGYYSSDANPLGIILGFGVLLSGFVGWAFLLTVCEIADDVKVIKNKLK